MASHLTHALISGALALSLIGVGACSARTIGRVPSASPRDSIKIGHDGPKEVLQKLGEPFRRSSDANGRDIFVYVWADGGGSGQKWLISFNDNGKAYIVEQAQ